MPHIPNPLEDFATYNYLFTMGIATPGEVNSASYRQKINNIVISSAGRFGGQRVETAYGSPEFFIDNVDIKSFVTPTPPSGNTSQMKVDFEVFEPYSLGLFLQSCQVAAVNAGYKNYMDNAPFVLKLEFLGQKTTNEFGTVGPYYFLVRLKKAEFTVNEAGSRYKVETFPYNHQLFNASVNTAFNEIQLTGKSAYEVLVGNPEKSFITQLTLRELQLVKDKKKKLPDYYAIEFVDCDWGGPNPFGDDKGGDLEFSAESSGGTEVYKRQGDVTSTDGKVVRGKVTLNPREKTLQYSQGTSLTDIINYTILSTKAARTNATDPTKFDKNGFVTWWRIDVGIQLLELDESTRDYNKVITFRVVPHKIHHTVYPGPEATARGIPELKKDITKSYTYIYTGKNTDVLKFDIEIKNLFFTPTDPNKQENSGVQSNPGVNASVQAPGQQATRPEGQSPPSTAGNANPIRPSLKVGNLPFKAGSGQLDTKQKVANEFYVNAMTKHSDMINLNIELLGDPFWLPEAGHGNYNPPGGGTQVANGVMNYPNRSIYVEVIFRTPIDVRGADGLLAFQDSEPKSPMSGLYQVTEVEHKFSGGLYKCTLKGPRMPAQDVESDADPLPVNLDNLTYYP